MVCGDLNVYEWDIRWSKGDKYICEEGIPNSHGESTKGEMKVVVGKTWKAKISPNVETYVICKHNFSYHTPRVQTKLNVWFLWGYTLCYDVTLTIIKTLRNKCKSNSLEHDQKINQFKIFLMTNSIDGVLHFSLKSFLFLSKNVIHNVSLYTQSKYQFFYPSSLHLYVHTIYDYLLWCYDFWLCFELVSSLFPSLM